MPNSGATVATHHELLSAHPTGMDGTATSSQWRAHVNFVLRRFGLDPDAPDVVAISTIDCFSQDAARRFGQTCFLLLKELGGVSSSSPTRSKSPDKSITSVVSQTFSESLKQATAQNSSESDFCFSISTCPVKQTQQLVKQQDNDGNKVINRYTVVDDLGRGAYGKVKLAVDDANCPVAIKIVRKSLLKKKQDGTNGVEREIAVMKKLKHRNVVPLYEVIDDPESEKLYMVMKYVDQGPITKQRPDGTCDTIPANRVKELMGELVAGLSYLHKRGVAHRDIKPDNILMDAAGTPYFADFGVSAIIDKNDPNVSTVEGTALFMPPELFGDQALKVDAFAADVWSLGVTLYMLLYGKAPFGGSNFREISAAVRSEEIVFPVDQWGELLRGMLCKDPAKRMKLKAIKKHPLLQEDVVAVTEEELDMAMSKISHFLLGGEEPLTRNLSRPLRRAVVELPRCAWRVGSVSLNSTCSLGFAPKAPPSHEKNTSWPRNSIESRAPSSPQGTEKTLPDSPGRKGSREKQQEPHGRRSLDEQCEAKGAHSAAAGGGRVAVVSLLGLSPQMSDSKKRGEGEEVEEEGNRSSVSPIAGPGADDLEARSRRGTRVQAVESFSGMFPNQSTEDSEGGVEGGLLTSASLLQLIQPTTAVVDKTVEIKSQERQIPQQDGK